MSEVPYQLIPQLEQLKAERDNAKALGLTDRVASVDKQIEAIRESAGLRKRAVEDGKTPPQKRQTKTEARGTTA